MIVPHIILSIAPFKEFRLWLMSCIDFPGGAEAGFPLCAVCLCGTGVLQMMLIKRQAGQELIKTCSHVFD